MLVAIQGARENPKVENLCAVFESQQRHPQGLWETDEFPTNLGDSLIRQKKKAFRESLKHVALWYAHKRTQAATCSEGWYGGSIRFPAHIAYI